MLQFAIPRRAFSLLTLVAVGGILLAIVLAERARRDLVQSNQSVIHSLDVERQFQSLLSTVLETERACQPAAATRDAEGSLTCERSQALVDSQLATVKRLTSDNPEQQRRLTNLSSVIAARMTELKAGLDGTGRGTAREIRKEADDAGEAVLSVVRTLIHTGIEEEQRLLAHRQTQLQNAIANRTFVTRILIACLVMAIATILYFWLRIMQLTPLVTLCAWSRTVKLGNEWVTFEEYLQRQFNISVTHAVSPDELAKILAEHPMPG